MTKYQADRNSKSLLSIKIKSPLFRVECNFIDSDFNYASIARISDTGDVISLMRFDSFIDFKDFIDIVQSMDKALQE